MPSYFCLSITFLAPLFHGRRDGGEPEWPPSPLRLFQALIAAAARRWQEPHFTAQARPAFLWLQEQTPPLVVAPLHHLGTPIRIAVPNNDMDVIANAWAHRREPKKKPSELKTLKTFCPVRLIAADGHSPTVHYLWPLADGNSEFAKHQQVLFAAASSITHLGWGIDMVAAHGSVIADADVEKLIGQRWQPSDDGAASSYRVPMGGTLDALITRHDAFLSRIGEDGFHPVPPLSAFRIVGYRRATDPPRRPFAAFSLLKPDASGFRVFDTVRRGMAVAAMLRSAAKNAAICSRPDDEPWLNQFILGHGEARGEPHKPVAGPRLAYIPLPTIEFRGAGRADVVGAVRRVLITVLPGDHQEQPDYSVASGEHSVGGRSDVDNIDWAGRVLSGMDLIPDRTRDCADGRSHPAIQPSDVQRHPSQSPQERVAVAMLARIPENDKMVQHYIRPATVWSSVTPMLLPGYDDPRHYRRRLKNGVSADEQIRLLARLEQRVDALIRKAIVQAGFSEILAQNTVLDWRKTGFWPGTDLADRYAVPQKLMKFSRYHVRILWQDASGTPIPVSGPICLGAGRFIGLGLFAAEEPDG
jgi:CRISPR-associated protein Csb2